jgi:hypothetical protein
MSSMPKDASADVLDASAPSPAPGNVLVSVLAARGTGTASAGLLAQVAAIVTAPGIRPLGDLVTVASAEIVPFAVTARLITFAGPDPELIVTAARAALATDIVPGWTGMGTASRVSEERTCHLTLDRFAKSVKISALESRDARHDNWKVHRGKVVAFGREVVFAGVPHMSLWAIDRL